MSEFKVTFHKYPHFLTSEEHTAFLASISKNKEAENTFNRDLRTIGMFDRMTIERVDSFSRSRDFSPYSKRWNGDSLSLLLYEIDEANNLSTMGMLVDDESESRLCYFPFEKGRFLALSFFSLSDLLMVVQTEKNCSYIDFLGELKKKIEMYIGEKAGLSYTLLGSFGLSDFCILWLADDYDDVLKSVESLKSLRLQVGEDKQETFLFSGFYTIFSLNRQEKESAASWKKNLAAFHGGINVYLSTRQESVGVDIRAEIKKFYSDTSWNSCSLHSLHGEFDLMITGPAALLLPQLLPEGFLYFGSDFYQKYLCATQVQILSESAIPFVPEIWNFERINFRILDPKDIFLKERELRGIIEGVNGQNGLRDKAKRAFSTLSCFVDDFDAFYHDLRDYLFSQAKLQRRLDCAERFKTILRVMENKLNRINGESEESDYLDRLWKERDEIQLLIKALCTQLSQERELSVLALDSPLCQGNFNGHQDLILHTYNNYLKEILCLIYALRGKEQQRVCPLISSSTIFQVRSTQFLGIVQRGGKKQERSSENSVSLVNYDLPTAVMVDMPFGIASILHETFHYVQPSSRKERNIISAVPFLCELTLRCLCSRLAEGMAAAKNVTDERVEAALTTMMLSVCKSSNEYTHYMKKMMALMDECYETSILANNPGHYYDIFCDTLLGMVKGDIPYNHGTDQFFAQCLIIAEETLFDLLNSYHYEIKKVKYAPLKNCTQKIRETICQDMKSRDYSFGYLVDYYRAELLDPYREIKADIGMLSVTGMTNTDYRLFFATLFCMVLGKPGELSPAEGFRLYCVTEYLRTQVDSTASDDFVDRYVSRFFIKNSAERKDGAYARQRVHELRRTAKRFQYYMNEQIKKVQQDYAVYKPFLDELIRLFDPRREMSDWDRQEIVTVSSAFIKESRQLEEVNAACLAELFYSEAVEGWDTPCELYQNQVFTSNLSFIHRMQNTTLLADLNNK